MAESYLNRNDFTFVMQIGDESLFENIVNIPLPSVSLSSFERRLGGSVNTKKPGDEFTFDALTVEFIVDDKMNNFFYVFDWMKSNKNYQTGKKKEDLRNGTLFLKNSRGGIIREVSFVGLFPTNLSEISFATNEKDVQFGMSTVTMEYLYYVWE